MRIRRHDQIHDTITLLKDAGATDIEVTNNKHAKVRFTVNGRRKLIVVPRSPSDWRTTQNRRTQIRRMLRDA